MANYCLIYLLTVGIFQNLFWVDFCAGPIFCKLDILMWVWDDWFSGPYGSPTITEKQKDYMEQETEIKKQEEENRQYWTNESEDIHQEMYDLATKNGKTTTQLNPVGGSETFQEGPGGWTSGTGYQGQGLTDH